MEVVEEDSENLHMEFSPAPNEQKANGTGEVATVLTLSQLCALCAMNLFVRMTLLYTVVPLYVWQLLTAPVRATLRKV